MNPIAWPDRFTTGLLVGIALSLMFYWSLA